jgi:hypothetical protein
MENAEDSNLKPRRIELALQRGHFALEFFRDKSNRCLGDCFERYNISRGRRRVFRRWQ